MKRITLYALFLVVAMVSVAQQLPQFSYKVFEGWNYANPSIELTQQNILNNKIVLYTTSHGLQHTLTSPQFSCRVGQTIDMTVTWVTDQWQNPNFVMRKVALTAALLDENDETVDSVTFTPTSLSRTNYVNLSITVPHRLTAAKLRFAAWNADVNSLGAVRQIVMTSTLRGDVNQDGEVSVADVNAVIDVILGSDDDEELRHRADVNRDSEVSVADINSVIDVIMG